MILIDTNVILASIRQPVTDADIQHHERATSLLRDVSLGTVSALIGEIVLHECYYVLVMRDKEIGPEAFCSLFNRMLDWPGWAHSDAEMTIFKSALDFLSDHPKLEFSDAVIAARAEYHDAELATFDRRLAEAYGGQIWAEG